MKKDYKITRNEESAVVMESKSDCFLFAVPATWTNTQIYKCIDLISEYYECGVSQGKREKAEEIRSFFRDKIGFSIR